MHNGAFYREKCIDWCQITSRGARSIVPIWLLPTFPKCQIFVHFILRWAVFELRANFESPKITLICSRLKVSICVQHTPARCNFHPFHSMKSRYRVTPPFLKKYTEWPQFPSISLYDKPFLSYGTIFGKCIKWPQMTLICSRSKIPRMHVTYTPRHKFTSVSLYDELFLSYWPIFGKVHRMSPNYLDIFKVKNTNMRFTHTPAPRFLSVSL